MWLQIKPVTVEFKRGWARRCWRLLLLVEAALTSSCYRCGWMLAVDAREIMRYWIRIDTLEIIQLWSNLRELWSPGGTDHHDRAKTRDWETAWHPTRVAGKLRVLSVVQGSIKTFFLRSVALADFDDVEQNKFINNVATLSGIPGIPCGIPSSVFPASLAASHDLFKSDQGCRFPPPASRLCQCSPRKRWGEGPNTVGEHILLSLSKFIQVSRFDFVLQISEIPQVIQVIRLAEYAGKLGDARHKWQRKVVDSFRTWLIWVHVGHVSINISRKSVDISLNPWVLSEHLGECSVSLDCFSPCFWFPFLTWHVFCFSVELEIFRMCQLSGICKTKGCSALRDGHLKSGTKSGTFHRDKTDAQH